MNALSPVSALTAPEWQGYTQYLERHPLKRGNATQHAYPAGFRDGVVYAGPSWVTLTDAQRDFHRQECRWGCLFDSDHRLFADCATCGDQTEAIGPDELSRCCGSATNLRGAS